MLSAGVVLDNISSVITAVDHDVSLTIRAGIPSEVLIIIIEQTYIVQGMLHWIILLLSFLNHVCACTWIV